MCSISIQFAIGDERVGQGDVSERSDAAAARDGNIRAFVFAVRNRQIDEAERAITDVIDDAVACRAIDRQRLGVGADQDEIVLVHVNRATRQGNGAAREHAQVYHVVGQRCRRADRIAQAAEAGVEAVAYHMRGCRGFGWQRCARRGQGQHQARHERPNP